MYKNFEFDKKGLVATALVYDPGVYIMDRMQEINGTRYGNIIDKTAELAIPGDDTLENKYQRLAFTAGSTVVFEAFEYAEIPKFKFDYAKHAFLCRGLPKGLKKQDADSIAEQIEFSALIGLASHPELQHITDIVSEYYTEITQNPSMQAPVNLGVGRMAFVLDKCFGALRLADPRFVIAQTLDETDWSGIVPDDITGGYK